MDTRTSRFALALALLSFSLIGAGCVAAGTGGDEDQVDLSGAPLGERWSAAYAAPNEVNEPDVIATVNEPDVTDGEVNEPDATDGEVNEPDATDGEVNEPDVSSLVMCNGNDVNCDAPSEQ